MVVFARQIRPDDGPLASSCGNRGAASFLDRLKPASDEAVNVKGRAIERCQGCGISATCETEATWGHHTQSRATRRVR
jgi:hypothetical protein